MPLESYQKISARPGKQKSSREKSPADKTLKERVRAIMKREKNEGHNKIVGETRMKLKELFSDIKTKNTPQKKAPREKDGDNNSNWTYQGLGVTSVKTADERMKMKVLGPKFGNEKGGITLGAMHKSEQNGPWEESHSSLGVAFAVHRNF